MRAAPALALAVLVACSGTPSERPEERAQEPGPYVVTAIDYHFHDAHPSLPIALDRTLEFSNQGTNLHNVTIPGTEFDRNLRPGRRLTVEPVSSLLPEPGRYPFFCKLHTDRGMEGVLIIVEEGAGT